MTQRLGAFAITDAPGPRLEEIEGVETWGRLGRMGDEDVSGSNV